MKSLWLESIPVTLLRDIRYPDGTIYFTLNLHIIGGFLHADAGFGRLLMFDSPIKPVEPYILGRKSS